MDNVYLVLGPEEKDADDFINSIFLKAKAKDDSIIKKHYFAFDKEDIDEALSDISSPSLFGTSYFVLLDSAESLSEKESELIAKSISNIQKDSFLVIRSLETNVSSKIDKVVKKENKKIFYLLIESKTIPYVVDTFREKGYKISNEVASDFLTLVEHNKKAILKAADELIIQKNDKNEITSADVFNYIQHNRDEGGFDLFFHIAKKDVNAVLLTVQNIILANPRGISAIIPSLLTYIRRSISYMENIRNSSPEPWLVNILGGYQSVIRFPSEKELIKTFFKNYTNDEANKLLSFLLDADIEMRKISQPFLQKIYFDINIARVVNKK